MPAGRPTKYDPAYCDRVIELGKEGKSQIQIACALNVDRTTMLGWARDHEEFQTALTRAKEYEQDWWEGVGQQALFADKFNSAVWSKSMSARFRHDYADKLTHSGDPESPIQAVTRIERVIVDPAAPTKVAGSDEP